MDAIQNGGAFCCCNVGGLRGSDGTVSEGYLINCEKEQAPEKNNAPGFSMFGHRQLRIFFRAA